jgi:tetrapyrrole methylase family protein / MazG family protein
MTTPDSRIVVVGLGPGTPELRTIGTQQALERADRIILRTRIHPGLCELESDPRVTDCDDLYERETRFESLYRAIAQRVLDAARSGGTVVFAVPGHPRFGERSVPLIEDTARVEEIPVEVLDGVSFVDVAVGVTKIDPLATGLQICDAEHLAATLNTDPFAAGRLGVDPTRPLLVAQLYNADLAATVKIALTRLYPDDHSVLLIQAVGDPADQIVRSLPLHSLDRLEVDHLTSLWVPSLTALDAVRSPDTLNRIVAQLRAPKGCPWDREQTHASLRTAVLAEAYEVVDAIDGDDDHGLVEELGDLLLLVTMHAQIAEEDGAFRIEDVYEGINRKLVRRHPHVFASATARTPEDVVKTWEGVKAAERAEKGESGGMRNPIDRLPRAMPVMRKVVEVIAPRATLQALDNVEAGDQLLSAIESLINRGIDPERALETSLRRFVEKRDGINDHLATAGAGVHQGSDQA